MHRISTVILTYFLIYLDKNFRVTMMLPNMDQSSYLDQAFNQHADKEAGSTVSQFNLEVSAGQRLLLV